MRIHETEIRVRYKETDNMGVVYYSNYFVWFEVGRTEYLRSRGVSYRELEEKGVYLMVVSAGCRYLCPARYDDVVRIRSWVPEVKHSSLRFEYTLFVGDTTIATGESVHVATDRSGKPIRIPKELKIAFTHTADKERRGTSSAPTLSRQRRK